MANNVEVSEGKALVRGCRTSQSLRLYGVGKAISIDLVNWSTVLDMDGCPVGSRLYYGDVWVPVEVFQGRASKGKASVHEALVTKCMGVKIMKFVDPKNLRLA